MNKKNDLAAGGNDTGSSPTETARLLAPAAEYVHHLHDCPSIGGNGDLDCRCGAVAFLALVESQSAQLSAAVGKIASIADAADAFARDDISSGKLAEILGCSDKHGFKTAAHAFCGRPLVAPPLTTEVSSSTAASSAQKKAGSQ